ncbi:MAG: hypothetical protein JRJ42_02320 [Deltaproteobacteria bacterium]|nr:hypothetical protein [Deltaproteobacteria bacterium]MBW2018556.1 hypothetical protein [Deltaproteobacteria bacterium]MBW2073291.1 hypothetical protein [Deltaproteobacteria bacterium]RLB83343.1 MAG: hypothetical protein DRH17_02880 [Deltaproteobacteria bacterium]
MAPKKTTKKTAKQEQDFVCPLCLFVGCLKNMTERKSAFFEHMNNARIEFLEGIKSLIDERIEAIKKGTGDKKSKLTKIKVED